MEDTLQWVPSVNQKSLSGQSGYKYKTLLVSKSDRDDNASGQLVNIQSVGIIVNVYDDRLQ